MADLTRVISGGESAFVAMDKTAMQARQDDMVLVVSCLVEPIGSPEAARAHRLIALLAFIQKDRQRVLDEFAVSLSLESHYLLPEGIVPIDHPITTLYEQAKVRVIASETQTVQAPVGGWSTVDGIRTNERHSSVSSIIQIMDGRGTVVDSRFVQPLQLLPTLDLSQYNIDLTRPAPQSIFKSKPTPWLIATGIGLLASGGLYAAGMIEKDRFNDTEHSVADSELVELRDTTNVLGYAWVGATTLTLATGVVTFTVVIPNHHRSHP